jgi:ABC-type antimicrobial peptide transport system permease subunit
MGTDSSIVIFVSVPDSSRDQHFFVLRAASGVPNVRMDVHRALVNALPPGSFSRVFPWTEGFEEQLAEERYLALVFSLLGAASLALGAAGLFSVVSYIASQRMREFAVRVALGATRESVARLVLREAFIMALGGTGIGAGLGMWAGFLIWERLWGVYPVDAVSLIAAEVTLLIVTMMACLVPAMRAMRADPVEVMRAT